MSKNFSELFDVQNRSKWNRFCANTTIFGRNLYFWSNPERVFNYIRNRVSNMWSRSRRGYGHVDVWGFDGYLLEVMIGGLNELKGSPGVASHFFDTMEDFWSSDNAIGDVALARRNQVYDEIISGFEAGQRIINITSEDDDADAEAFVQAWTKMGEIFFSLWD